MDNQKLAERQNQSPDWVTWLKWVAVSMAAILIGGGMIYFLIFLAKVIAPGTNEDRLAGWIMLPVVGLALGTAQWLVLRDHIRRSGWWILATGAGLPAGIALASLALQAASYSTGQAWALDGSRPVLLLVYAVVGFSLSLAQTPILWRNIWSLASWLLLSMAGWMVLGLIIGVSIDRTSDIFAVGTVPATFTGFGLLWIIRTQPVQTSQRREEHANQLKPTLPG